MAGRTVEVRPSWYVPAVPDATLTKIYGDRTADPRVEYAVLTFEYWDGGGKISRSLLYDETLSGSRGFWILVVPGVIHNRQPRFNEGAAMWHLEGATLPLLKPLSGGAA